MSDAAVGGVVFHFVANLKPYTLDDANRRAWCRSYLLSVDYAAGMRPLVETLHRTQRVLAADNGNFDRISTLLRTLEVTAAAAGAMLIREEAALRRYVRSGDLSPALVRRFERIARQVEAAALAARNEDRVREVVAEQVALGPSYLIGMEDFRTPLLVGLGVEREYSDIPVGWYVRGASRALTYARKTRRGDFGPCPALVFAGVHAPDLDVARAIGRAAGEEGVDGIATGLGAALDDRNFTDHRLVNGVVVPFDEPVPRPYLRVLEVVAGLHLGHAEVTGRLPRFHALGAGTPILLPLIAALGGPGTYTATDSTSPIKDGYSSATISVYVNRPAPLKLKAYRIAERWLDGGRAWACPCHHCRAFVRAHPFRLGDARSWWRAERRRRLLPSDMWSPSPLAEYMSVLAMPRDTAVRRQAGLARVGHNHWVLRQLEAGLQRHGRTRSGLLNHVELLVERYVRASSAPAWKSATLAAWSVASSAASELRGVRPGGLVPPSRST